MGQETLVSAVSHCSAVLYACFRGEVGPGEQGAQQRLGLSVQPLWEGAGAEAGQSCSNMLDIIKYCPWRVSSINVQNISESILEHPSYGVVVGQVVVLPEVPVLIEVDGSVVGGEDVQVDGLTVVLCSG